MRLKIYTIFLVVFLSIISFSSAELILQDRVYYKEIDSNFSGIQSSTTPVLVYNGSNYFVYNDVNEFGQVNMVGLNVDGSVSWGPYKVARTWEQCGYSSDCTFSLPARAVRSIEDDGFVVFTTAYQRIHVVKIYDNGTVDPKVFNTSTGIAYVGNMNYGFLDVGKGADTYAAYIYGSCENGVGAVFNQDLSVRIVSSISNYSHCSGESFLDMYDYDNDFYLMLDVYAGASSRYLWINKTNPAHTMYSQYGPSTAASYANYWKSWAFDRDTKTIYVFAHVFFGSDGQSYLKQFDVSSLGSTPTEISSYYFGSTTSSCDGLDIFRTGKYSIYLGDDTASLVGFCYATGEGKVYDFNKADVSILSETIVFNSTEMNMTTISDNTASNFLGHYFSGNNYLFFDSKGIILLETSSPCDIYSGLGTEVDPYIIMDNTDFESIESCDSSAYYKLGSDLIGPSYGTISGFSGTLDGDGYTIYNQTSILFLGTMSGTVKNLNIDWPDVNECSVLTEILSGNVSNIEIVAAISGSCGSDFGSIASIGSGVLDDISAYISGDGGSGFITAGLIGRINTESIVLTNSHLEVNITGEVASSAFGDSGWGGPVFIDGLSGSINVPLLGNMDVLVDIRNINLTVAGSGCLVGMMSSTTNISNTSVYGTTLIGGVFVSDTQTGNVFIEDSSFSGDILYAQNVGGFIGVSGGDVTIRNSRVSGSVTSEAGNVGGLIGSVSGNVYIYDNQVNANILSIAGQQVGGLIGVDAALFTTIINNSRFSGSIDSSDTYTGGLVGLSGDYSNLEIYNSHVIANINNTGLYGQVGGLVGSYWDAIIDNSSFEGNVYCEDCASEVGGLAGGAAGNTSISNSHAIGNIYGREFVAGIIGTPGVVVINNSYFIGNVVSVGNIGTGYVGGIAGGIESYEQYDNIVENSYVIGNVTSDGPNVGGITGVLTQGTLKNSYANVNVNGTSDVGGLVGQSPSGYIDTSYSTGNVHGIGDRTGGLVGINIGYVNNSYSTSDVTQDTANNAGGLIGTNEVGGVIENSYATGSVIAEGSDGVGGLVGANGGSIYSSHSSGSVRGLQSVGGLAGYANNVIMNSYSDSDVFGINTYIGGLVGFFETGQVTDSYSTGSVNGYDTNGGLIGILYGSVERSYATGDVSGVSTVGGLIGNVVMGATVNNSYATGATSGDYAAGLVSSQEGIVQNSYAVGAVLGTNTGGLTAYSINGEVNSYWDAETSGISTVVYTKWNEKITTSSSVDGVNLSLTGVTVGDTRYYGPVLSGVDQQNACNYALNDYYTVYAGKFISTVDETPYIESVCIIDENLPTTHQEAPTMGLPLTTTEMKIQSNLVGFDYENTWGQDDTYEYPQLGSKTLKLTAYNCTNVNPLELSTVTMPFSAASNDGTLSAELYSGSNYMNVQCLDENIAFSDGAESGVITDKWTISAGSAEYSTDRSYSGTKSIKLNTGSTVIYPIVSPSYPHTISVRFYDDGSPSPYYVTGEYGGGTCYLSIGIFQGWYEGNYAYVKQSPGGGCGVFDTGIARTIGWKLYEYTIVDSTHVTMKVDGVQVFSGEVETLTNTDFRIVYFFSGDPYYFDDMQVTEAIDGVECEASMPYYASAGGYNLLATMTNGSETLHRVIPGLCSYGELQATVREGNDIAFSGSVYGVQNKTPDAPLVFENTGNKPITVAYLTAYNLVSAVPGYILNVSNFRAGLTLNNSVQLEDSTPVSVPFELISGSSSKVNFYVWSNIPANQYPTQYISTKSWGLTLE